MASVRRVLRATQLLGLVLVILAIFVFPLASALWEFVEILGLGPKGSSILAIFFDSLDAGAQSALSRALLRGILAWGCVLALLLPLDSVNNAKPWGALFLFWGALAVVCSSRPELAEREWETWALTLLFAFLLRRCRHRAFGFVVGFGIYALCFGVFFHALWIGVPETQGRLGGVFHHANALSTFCLIVQPFLLWRSTELGWERFFASTLAGALGCVLIWSGSLTGGILALSALAFFTKRTSSLTIRSLLGIGTAILALGLNLMGGWWAALGYPLLFVVLLLIAIIANEGRFRFDTWMTLLVSLVLTAGLFVALSPGDENTGVVHNRGNSGAARLEFYRAGMELLFENPVLGCGPRGFGREYPRVSESATYFSKFVHCVPLELALEWGVPAFLFGCLGLRVLVGQRHTVSQKVFLATFSLLLLHSLSGVQSQFPILIVLVALSWSVLDESAEHVEGNERWWNMAARFLLALVLMCVVGVNLLRATADFDSRAAIKLTKIYGSRATLPIQQLLQSSCLVYPPNGEPWFQWANYSLNNGRPELAAAKSEQAILSDSRWAAPRKVWGEARLGTLSDEQIGEFLSIDPINYPTFYRFLAENLVRRDEVEQARDLLREKAPLYHAIEMNSLPDFRSRDLEQQLVEFWLLLAIIEEKLDNERGSEAAFRMALFHCRKRLSRFRKMIDYPLRAELKPGIHVQDLLLQLSKQLPTEDIPSPTGSSSNKSREL